MEDAQDGYVEETQVEEMTDADLTEATDVPEEQDTPVVPDPEPITVETLQTELKETKESLERQLRSNTDKEQFIQRQTHELGELRKIKTALLERKRQLEETDPGQQMIDDPAGFRRTPLELAKIERDMREIETHEQGLQRSQQEEVTRTTLLGTPDAPGVSHDLADNMGEIEKILLDSGDTPDIVGRFKANPFSFPAPIVRSLNAQARIAKENAELKSEVERLRGKPASVLSQIEQTARKPLTNAAGGSAKTASSISDLNDQDIANLSNADLDRLLKEAG